MSQRGHDLDNSVAEGFLHLLKTERVKRKIYTKRADIISPTYGVFFVARVIFYRGYKRHIKFLLL